MSALNKNSEAGSPARAADRPPDRPHESGRYSCTHATAPPHRPTLSPYLAGIVDAVPSGENFNSYIRHQRPRRWLSTPTPRCSLLRTMMLHSRSNETLHLSCLVGLVQDICFEWYKIYLQCYFMIYDVFESVVQSNDLKHATLRVGRVARVVNIVARARCGEPPWLLSHYYCWQHLRAYRSHCTRHACPC